MKDISKHFYPTPQQFIDFTHESTERMAIRVIIDRANFEEVKGLKRLTDFYLTDDLYADQERILKYYGDAPLWNLHVSWDTFHGAKKGTSYRGINYVLVANVHFSDIMEGYLKEKKDRKKNKNNEQI